MKSVLLVFIFISTYTGVFSQSTIQYVVNNAGVLNQKNVEITGTVKKTIPLAGLCSYILEDHGSEILINSGKGCPSTAAKLIVQGKLSRISGETNYYIDEISRKPFTGSISQQHGTDNKDKVFTAPIVVETEVEESTLDIEEGKKEAVDIVAESKGDTDDEPAYVFVEESATFQGGDINTFREWIQKNLVYPPKAIENDIYGKIIIQFAVNKNGEATDIKVIRGVDPLLDNEAMRVVMASPRWLPARQGGKVVKQLFVFPVVFMLN